MDLLLQHPNVVSCEFKKGDYIIRQGEEILYLYYLVSGTCYRTTFTEKGDEIIYGIKKSNKSFQSLIGVMLLYSSGISKNNFIARNNCKCYKIPKDVFLNYVKDKPDVLNELLYMVMKEYEDLIDSFQARQEGKISNYLCNQLLKNAKEYQGKLLVNKDFSSQATISRFLGIHKVTVAKIIKALKDQGIIDREKNGIVILDQKRLESYAKGEQILDY